MAEERVKTAAQVKAEAVFSLLHMRLTAAQNLLRSLRQDHAEQCRLIALGAGGNVDGLVKRMREIETRILAMKPLLAYAEARVTGAVVQSDLSDVVRSGADHDSYLNQVPEVVA